jgi:hypothetical protein
MAARKKSDEYARLEAAVEGLVSELVRGLAGLFNREIPARVREALADPSKSPPSKGRKKSSSKKTRRKRSPR